MFSKIINTIWPEKAIEKEAIKIWNDGDFIIDWRAPILGQRWDEKYLPYWRKFPEKHANSTFVFRYVETLASIDDYQFLLCAGKQFSYPDEHQRALTDSAGRGHLEIFKAFPREHVQAYAEKYKVPQRESEFLPLVHPDVVAMMRQAGCWSQGDIDAMAEDYQFFNAQTANINDFDNDRDGESTKEYLQDWCLKVLRDYQWSADKQAQFLGNMMMTLKGDVWLDNAEMFKPFLNASVDVALLASVCGLPPKHYGTVVDDPGVELLYESLQQVSVHYRWFLWDPEETIDTGLLKIKGGHPGFNILTDLAPPRRPMDLYRMALQVKQQELGKVVTESLALHDFS